MTTPTAKPRHDHAVALAVAREVAALLQPVCERVEIVGSLRRQRPTVGDIELLYIGRRGPVRDGLFFKDGDTAEALIDDWLATGYVSKRLGANDKTTAWGAKNKLGVHATSGISLDLFATTAANWWVSLVIRTGGKETNLRLTTSALARDRSLQAYGSGVYCGSGQFIPATSEAEVFALCGVPYLPPEQRP